jgi:osmotically-inducible protein OsmY
MLSMLPTLTLKLILILDFWLVVDEAIAMIGQRKSVVHEKDQVNAMLKESESRRVGADESRDSPMVAAICERLASSSHCGLRNIQVHVDRQHVLLSGKVSTYFLKQTAQEVARAVCPTRQVKNSIVVGDPVTIVPPESS